MSAWGAFAGGVGGAASQLAGRYIDEELAQQRAQALSDMQFANSKRTEEYAQSEAVQGPRRTNAAKDQEQARASALTQAAAIRKQGNQLDIEDSQNPELARVAELAAADKRRRSIDDQDALRPGAIATAEATSRIQADSQIRVKNAEGANLLKAIGARDGGKTAGKYDRMDEADKLQFQSVLGEVKAAKDSLAKFEVEGQPFDKDGKPTQQYALLQSRVAAAAKASISFQMRKGLADPADDAIRAIGGEKDASRIGQSIGQAYEMGGSKYGDEFFEAVRKSGRLEELADERAPEPSTSKPSLLDQARNAGRSQSAAKPEQKGGRLAELQKRIATDDAIKSGGFGGMGARAIQSRAFPMGLGERRSVEEEINRLMGN